MMEPELKNVVRVTPSEKIRFKCSGCGECCRHVKETVPVDCQDIFYLSKFFRDSGEKYYCPDQVIQKFAEPVLINESGYFVYFLKSVGEQDACIFLKDNRCRIQKAKPKACKIYPFVVEPNESGKHRYLLSRERTAHFKGPQTDVKAWMKKYFNQESREFLASDFGKAPQLSILLSRIPENRKTEALLHFLRLRYSEYDLDQPFLDQFQRNQEKLLAVLENMCEK